MKSMILVGLCAFLHLYSLRGTLRADVVMIKWLTYPLESMDIHRASPCRQQRSTLNLGNWVFVLVCFIFVCAFYSECWLLVVSVSFWNLDRSRNDYQEHMEAKAEDHIRDIRTDAEISQLDSIEEAAPWLQVDFRISFSSRSFTHCSELRRRNT